MKMSLTVLAFAHLFVLSSTYANPPANDVEAKEPAALIAENGLLTKRFGLTHGALCIIKVTDYHQLTFYAYRNFASNEWFSVEGVSGMNRLLRAEPELLDGGGMPGCVILLLEGGTGEFWLISSTPKLASIPVAAVVSKAKGSDAAEVVRKLVKEDSMEPNLTRHEGRWILSFYVETLKGGLERWTVEGSIRPLQLSGLSRTSVLPSGALMLKMLK